MPIKELLNPDPSKHKGKIYPQPKGEFRPVWTVNVSGSLVSFCRPKGYAEFTILEKTYQREIEEHRTYVNVSKSSLNRVNKACSKLVNYDMAEIELHPDGYFLTMK